MVHYKLTYFDTRGVVEPVRLIFHYSGQEFEDDRLTDKNLDPIRDELPFGQVPVLTINGTTKIAQSKAIFRFLARKFGLAGKDDIEEAIVDGYSEFFGDLLQNLRPYFQVASGRAEGDKEKLEAEVQTYIDTKWEKYFSRVFESSGSGFMAKSGLTWVDFYVANLYENALQNDVKVVLNIKNLKTIYDNVMALPQLSKYLAQRKSN